VVREARAGEGRLHRAPALSAPQLPSRGPEGPLENAPVAAPEAVPSPSRAEFVGSGGEYFRIWIVNVALTLATLGIYSPWAKVRRTQYFHRNLRLAGAGFDYDANPWAILRGRALALFLVVGLQVGARTNPVLNGIAGLLLLAAFPWLVTASLRFRLYHTRHRGLRFSFHGSVADAFRVYIAWPIVAVLTLGLLMPASIQRRQRFVYGGGAFGGTRFESQLAIGALYRLCFGTAWIVLGASLAAGLAFAAGLSAAAQRIAEASPGARAGPPLVPVLVAIAVFLAGLVIASCHYEVRLQNLVWNQLRLGPHRFRSHQTLASFLALRLGNLVGAVATLGLFLPWAEVRTARWRAVHTEIVPGGSLEVFAAGAAQAESAAGDELAELFGFDVGF
jgi:uncharacterized membrane protein YjgN (DUF898 family)